MHLEVLITHRCFTTQGFRTIWLNEEGHYVYNSTSSVIKGTLTLGLWWKHFSKRVEIFERLFRQTHNDLPTGHRCPRWRIISIFPSLHSPSAAALQRRRASWLGPLASRSSISGAKCKTERIIVLPAGAHTVRMSYCGVSSNNAIVNAPLSARQSLINFEIA